MVGCQRWRATAGAVWSLMIALAGCSAAQTAGTAGGDTPTTAPSAGNSVQPSGETFGTQPCGKLVSFEEIAAQTDVSPAIVNVGGDGECSYEDDAEFEVLSVLLVSDPAGHLSCTAADGTYLGQPVEQVDGIGDTAVWSASAGSLCFVKGTNRVHISLSTQVSDPKAVSSALAAKASQRLP